MLNRRELFRLATAAIAAKSIFPAALVDNVAKAENWRPICLTAEQNDILVALTECIIPRTDTPGAADAKVNRYMDLILSEVPEKDRAPLLEGLANLDSKAGQKYGQGFAKCTREQQDALVGDLAGANDPFFQRVKQGTAAIYYNTPEGYKELNKFGVPATFSCQA